MLAMFRFIQERIYTIDFIGNTTDRPLLQAHNRIAGEECTWLMERRGADPGKSSFNA
jgi:hypothetical protein